MEYNPEKNVLVGARYPIEAGLLQKLDALIDKYALASPIKGVMPVKNFRVFTPRFMYVLAIAPDKATGKNFCAKAEELGAVTALVDKQTPYEDASTLEQELLDMRDLLARKTPEELERLGRKKFRYLD
jgi:hypothetical protein